MRLPDWQSRLAAVVKEHQRSGFRWGQTDCCLFISAAIKAVVGIDPGVEFRGTYSNIAGAHRRIKQICGTGGIRALAAQVAERYGFTEIDPIHAQRGDVGLYHDAIVGFALGVSIGPSFAFMTEQGMIYLPPSEIERAWKIA